jgi:urease subunit gamma/beta
MMLLSEAERDRLLVFLTAELARARRRRGLRLNAVEATALVADAVCEAARDGGRLADAIEAGRSVLTERDVLPGVIRAVPEVRVEAVFDDGTRGCASTGRRRTACTWPSRPGRRCGSSPAAPGRCGHEADAGLCWR